MRHKLRIFASVLLLTFGFWSNGVSQWVPANGFPGGSIPSLAVSGHTVIASTCCQGRASALFLSGNDGASWSVVTAPFYSNGGNTGDLAVIGTNIFASSDSGLARSSDYGLSWTRMN